MAKSYKVSVFAGTKVVADMAQQVKNATIEASIQLKTIKGGASSATPTILAPGPLGANRKMEDVIGWFVNGTAANPPVATGTPWEAPAGNKNTNWWNGTTWSLASSVALPKGQGLLALFDAAKAGGYAKDAQVRDANGVIYVSLKDGNISALSVKEDWGIVFNGAINIINNEEFLYAIIDPNDTILWGKRRDGSTYDCDFTYTQYTDEQIASIKSQLVVLRSEIDLAIANVSANLTNLKNDYEAFKLDYNSKFSVITNEEFLYAVIDPNNVILWGKRRDGTTYDCDTEIVDSIKVLQTDVSQIKDGFSFVSNDEFLYAVVDYNNVLLWGKRRDGSTYDCDTEIAGAVKTLQTDVSALKDNFSLITNEEYLYAILDPNNTILWGKKRDGTTYDCDTEIVDSIKTIQSDVSAIKDWISVISNDEFLYAVVDYNNVILWGKRRDGTTYDCDTEISGAVKTLQTDVSQIKDGFTVSTNEEYLLVAVDKNENVLFGSDRDGQFYAPKAGFNRVATDYLSLSATAMTAFQKELKESGFNSGVGDWSDQQDVVVPIPRTLGMANIIAQKLPSTKTDNLNAVLEYYDKDGNYIKTNVILNTQGDTSLAFEKKNLSVDFLTNDGGERTIKFGDWVARNSFHFKAYYIDSFVGQCVVSYKHVMGYYNTRPINQNRPYKKYGLAVDMWQGSGDLLQDMGTEARCVPDGFPIELYFNGAYYGLFVISLSKHRSNYNLNKDNTNHVFLDGQLGSSEIFGGNVQWDKFEIRNPSKLKDINGNDYNGDAPKELSSTHAKSLAVKNNIIRLSGALAAINSQSTTALKRSKFEEYFDVQEMIDYVIDANLKMNYDGFWKNWLWTTYNGSIWMPNFYDHDSIFSQSVTGNVFLKTLDPSTNILGTSSSIPSGYIFTLYKAEMDARYKELRDKGIISVNNIYGILENWTKTIGKDAYSKNLKAWPETPSYRASKVNSEFWELIGDNNSISTYDSSVTYSAGQEVFFGLERFYRFRAKKESTGKAPLTGFYTKFPREVGCYQSLERVRLWLVARISKLDSYFNY
ncbi:CotH kinase family protein [Sphingobacterium multivorum]|uniref:CotH kinase family protein n=1 Tax=Sphingobacterium multivorum TaxID=28454 RepID=UPI003DA51EB8